MNSYEEITDEQLLSTALNTYQFIVLGRDYEDIINENTGDSYFFIDVTNRLVLEDVVGALDECIGVLEVNEHYEKCADICLLLETHGL
ncbi:MAG: hypothetical protein QNK63_10185 [Flavobacteriales bacterium]|mgnify:CR=1 FL=1|jgi:hypothetical protein|tara:strand:+ start:243 stop:506 length:264 start_codon:yes stop_codon:yes gene_type:complete